MGGGVCARDQGKVLNKRYWVGTKTKSRVGENYLIYMVTFSLIYTSVELLCGLDR